MAKKAKAERAGKVRVCTPKRLPEETWVSAARTAVAANPCNAPNVAGLAMMVASVVAVSAGGTAAGKNSGGGGSSPIAGGAAGETVDFDSLPAMGDVKEILPPARLALLTTKYWGSGGVKLTVGFMETLSDSLANKILSHMNAWRDVAGANVEFVRTKTDPQVRISRGRGGYWSYLGTDIKHVPSNQQTMNLEAFTERTDDSEFVRVIRHETGHCFSGDTLIDCPRDLLKYPMGIPLREMAGTRPWVYAWENGQVVLRKASRVWRTRRAARVLRVRLKTGEPSTCKPYLPPLELVGTPDHRILLADGVTWKTLGTLEVGDRLCSLYRGGYGDEGYSTIRWTGGKRVSEHRFLCEAVNGPRPDNHDAHHINGNNRDQRPENLEWKERREHTSHHHKGKTITNSHRQAIGAALRGRTVGPSTHEKMKAAQAARAGWKHTDETRAKMVESAKGRPPMGSEQRAKVSAQFKGKKQSVELVEKRNASMGRFYANGGRSGMYGKKDSEETRRKKSEALRAYHERKRRAGEGTAANHVVVSVEPAGFEDVYDMTVPGAHSFIANGVVVHNCLGFPHEHLRRDLVARLDPNKTIAYFRRTQGWSAEEVRQQVLTAIDEAELTSPTPADALSIMCYQLPASITVDNQPILGGADLDENDKSYARKVYPSAAVVSPPPPSKERTLVFRADGTLVLDGKLV